ncbi:MAG TPA: 23S rRNA (adenine(2503)-C(2))-methyltransferase RlmN [Rhabdochlamydiaceae bacterium]
MTISPYSHTQKSFVDAIASLLGKGKRHAALLYAQWMREGNIFLDRMEAQALPLTQEILGLCDRSLPELSLIKEEGKTVKFLLKYADGLESESVVLPMHNAVTLCISSQVGCKMGCTFCETGKMGLLRHLTAAEIVSQVYYARHILNHPVRNIVFMGMGEPFDNYEAVMQAIAVLTDPAGLKVVPRRITVSTSGNVDAIGRFTADADPALNLAVSVNAPNDQVRDKIMPVNKKWNMEQLKAAMQAYCAHPRRKILVEYVLLKGVNDSLDDADELASYLEGLKVKVNLIPYNAQKRDRFAPPQQEQLDIFLERLRAKGYQTLLRQNKGRAIMAACGQLGDLQQRKHWVKIGRKGEADHGG